MSRTAADTRSRILDAAWRLLEADASGGAVRISDIAKAAGISRQALYLYFPTRAELLIATTRRMDEALEVEARLSASRAASSGVERLDAFVAFMGGHLPQIAGVARALMAMREADEAADAAWRDRFGAVREGCAAAIEALAAEGRMAPGWTTETATDQLWAMLSYAAWRELTAECGWTNEAFIRRTQRAARSIFVAPPGVSRSKGRGPG